MYNFSLTQEAKEDLYRIYDFGVHKFGENQADKYFMLLHECFHKIAANPWMFPIDTKHKDIDRYCVCGVETVYFNVKVDEVIIVTIIGRQDF